VSRSLTKNFPTQRRIQLTIIRPGHQRRLTGPCPPSISLGAVLACSAGIRFLARIDRSRDLALMLLHQSLALLHILGPLRPSAVIILLAAIDIFVHLFPALRGQISRPVLGLLRKHSRPVLRIQSARYQILTGLLTGLRRIQHANQRADAKPGEKPSQSAYSTFVVVICHAHSPVRLHVRNLLPPLLYR